MDKTCRFPAVCPDSRVRGEASEGRKGAFRPMASDGVSSSSRRSGVRQPYCKFFLWLDEHIASLGVGVTRYPGEEQIFYGEEHQWNKDMENRITLLEKRIVAIEVKKIPIGWSICVMFIVLIVAILSCKK
ncbi:hypothetical protein Ahy_B08g091415 [Arachis hypogaea]|uniref:Uncharacterized protein n=1 Tax=Arachis hypogaea TaxID=3818 RepID=A0A444Y231_ARAHY|nr:hypothetical protein Ahy_B08g091415 [Arachis hypogaea]